MESKKIDNEIINSKKRINEIDNMLNNEKNRIKNINDIQNNIYELNKNTNKCIELLSKSIKGKRTNASLDDIRNNNRTFYIKASNILENETSEIKKKIAILYREKNEEIEKNKKEKE